MTIETDNIRVIERDTNDIRKEVIETFNEMLPYLNTGYSYTQAYKIVKGINYNSFTNKWWWRLLLEYGESQGYSIEDYTNLRRPQNKHGIYNLFFVKNNQNRTGYVWAYEYYSSDDKVHRLTSMDLKVLRKKVEEKGMPWIITDISKARESYRLSERLLRENPLVDKRKEYHTKRNKYGVKYVYLNKGYYHYQNRKVKCFSSTTLNGLREKVIDYGLPWEIIDNDKYMYWLKKDEQKRKVRKEHERIQEKLKWYGVI